MANLEHLRVLRKGVTIWNYWRGKNPSVRPDLSSAQLNLSKSHDLDEPYDKYLNFGNFCGADLRNSEISNVCMADANLDFADLSGSIILNSSLDRASFHGATFISTVLSYSTMERSAFMGARFGEVQLVGLDLSAAIGLEEIDHSSPSNIDRGTLEATAKGLLRTAVKDRQRNSIDYFLRRSGNGDRIGDLLALLRL